MKKAEAEGPRTFDKDGIRGANPRVPQQTNYSDCGIYILQYVESFFEVSYSLTDIRQDVYTQSSKVHCPILETRRVVGKVSIRSLPKSSLPF